MIAAMAVAVPMASASPAGSASAYVPAWQQAPNGFCKGRTVAVADAFAPKKRFVLYEATGDARGPHIFTASATARGYDCVDGRSQVAFDLQWDARAIVNATIRGQLQAIRAAAPRAGSPFFYLKPRTASRCCPVAKFLPTVTLRAPRGRLASISIPLFNRDPTVYSFAADTKGGLKASFRYARR